MNRNVLLLIAAIVLFVVVTLFINDGWIYSATTLAALIIMSVIRYFKSWVMGLTRWAKENPRKTQVLITILQIVILSSGLLVGYDLKELGSHIGYIPTIVFGAILSWAFLSIRFLPKRNTIAIPVAVNKDRMAYMGVALSAFVLMVITGNRIEDKFPNSPISQALRSIDHAMFSQELVSNDDIDLEPESGQEIQQAMLINGNESTLSFASVALTGENSIASAIHPEKKAAEKIKSGKKAAKFERMKKRMMKRIEKLRKAFAGGVSAGVIFLVILLIIASCAGICIALSGGGAGSVALGIVILGLAIFGSVKLLSHNKKVKEPKAGT